MINPTEQSGMLQKPVKRYFERWTVPVFYRMGKTRITVLNDFCMFIGNPL